MKRTFRGKIPQLDLIGLVLIAACGSGSDATTSTLEPGTTTTSGASTTTTVETTTSTQATTTTATGATSPAAIASRYGFMGWWSETGWVVPESLEEIPLVGGEEYEVVMLDQPITTAVGSAPTLCEPSLTPVMEFDPPLPGEFRDPGGLAIIADWELRPSEVRVESELADVHRQAVVDALASAGIETDPVISQIVAADIEGDGTEEVVIVSKEMPEDLFGQPGNYSIVILRKMIEGEWQTAILETSLAEVDQAYILSHSIAAIADLNGDGKMEIAVDAVYYEGSGTVAYEYTNDDLGPQPVLGGGCGA